MSLLGATHPPHNVFTGPPQPPFARVRESDLETEVSTASINVYFTLLSGTEMIIIIII
jgi:hypothetical protein